MLIDASRNCCSLIIASILRVNKFVSRECWTGKGEENVCIIQKFKWYFSGFTQCSLKYCTEERMQSVGSTFLRNFVGKGVGGILAGVERPIVLHGVKTHKTSIILWIHLAWVSGFRFLRPSKWTGSACEFYDPHTFKSEERDVSVCVCLSIHPTHSMKVRGVCRYTVLSKINPFYCQFNSCACIHSLCKAAVLYRVMKNTRSINLPPRTSNHKQNSCFV